MPAMNRKFQGSSLRRFMASSNVRSPETLPYFLSVFLESAQVLSNFLQRSLSRKLGGSWDVLYFFSSAMAIIKLERPLQGAASVVAATSLAKPWALRKRGTGPHPLVSFLV